MSPLYELLLLQIISKNGNIATFIQQGFTYAQIFKQIKEFENRGVVILNKETNIIEVTPMGIERMNEINKLFGRTNSNAWISPLYEKMIKKIEIDDVYLPKKNLTNSSY